MASGIERHGRGSGPFLLGGSLIVLGILLFVIQFFNFDFALAGALWPLFIVVPGVLLCGVAVVNRGRSGESLAIVGSIVTMLGLLLLYQNTTGHWENWAYSWALLVPTAVGLGQIVYGAFTQQPLLVKAGTRLAMIGGAIFLVGFFFFEVILGIGGMGLARVGMSRLSWPVLLIGIGVIVIIYTLMSPRDDTPTRPGDAG